jgi:hypothetical protein
MKYSRITDAEDNFRPPVFWQTPCCTHTLSPLSSIMCFCIAPLGVACALGKAGSWAGWLLCSGFVCLPMCLTCSVGLLEWSCQRMLKSGCYKYWSVSFIAKSLMLAKRFFINPFSSNSQFSLP